VLLELLQEYQLDGYLIMVSRIFGGIKLGQGGVARAFRNTGRGVIEAYVNQQ
jgi:putative IMPACT (imprinted ancient) family translation regulator